MIRISSEAEDSFEGEDETTGEDSSKLIANEDVTLTLKDTVWLHWKFVSVNSVGTAEVQLTEKQKANEVAPTDYSLCIRRSTIHWKTRSKWGGTHWLLTLRWALHMHHQLLIALWPEVVYCLYHQNIPFVTTPIGARWEIECNFHSFKRQNNSCLKKALTIKTTGS